ncbi:unnamed protein product, partial [Ectocarpus fasciculatus]
PPAGPPPPPPPPPPPQPTKGMHGAPLPVRGGVALRADPGALEAVGIAGDAGLPTAAVDARVGAGRPVPLHLRRPAFVVAHAGPHGLDGLGVHHGASAPSS